MNPIKRPTILIVEDDLKTADLIRLYLQNGGYDCLVAHEGETALRLAQQEMPDLVVLDIMLPQRDGLEICRALRADAQLSDVPIIMLTARSTEMDTLIGLDVGADDYITKPFSPRELVARVRTVLRRTAAPSALPKRLSFVGLTIHFEQFQVLREGNLIELTRREFSLLAAMAAEPQRVFSREQLAVRAFGHEYDGNGRSLDVHIMRLRKKLERDASQPDYIHTVYGVGYKFAPPEEQPLSPERS